MIAWVVDKTLRKPNCSSSEVIAFKKMVPNVEPIGCSLNLGEGPFWDDESQTLYYVDIFKHTVHSYNPRAKKHYSAPVETDGQPVSLIVKIQGEKNSFLISVKNSLAKVTWNGETSDPLIPEHFADLEGKDETTRINDGKCDPSNRLWAGTMGSVLAGTDDQWEQEKGSLYLIKNDKTVSLKEAKIGISNGLAWSLDKKTFYYIDSLNYSVDSFDYDEAFGSLSNKKTIYCFRQNNIKGIPDGMTIDQEGMLWVACYAGAQVLRIDPASGKLLQTLEIPSLQTTSVAFGGPDFEDLYVTSAKVGFTKELEEKYPYAGYTFRVTGLGVKGTPSVLFKA